jgi:hypothetical protein
VADALSSDSGTVSLRLVPGTYTVSIRRIGVRPRQVPGVSVGPEGSRALDLRLASLRVELQAVQVVANTTCGKAPDGNDRTAALWEQISLALRAATITQRENLALPPLRVVERTNDLSPTLEQYGSFVTRDAIGMTRPVQADHPDSLALLGYVRKVDRDRQYYAPDEQVLLSDAFLRTHCFTTAPRDEDASLAELRFSPVKGRPIADVEGTAYVDISTGELRRIAYRFVASRQLIPDRAPHAGGDVFLRRLPSGAWIVNKWSIRMPLFSRSIVTNEMVLTGYREVAGVVEDAPAP